MFYIQDVPSRDEIAVRLTVNRYSTVPPYTQTSGDIIQIITQDVHIFIKLVLLTRTSRLTEIRTRETTDELGLCITSIHRYHPTN